jgi:hypothetical protein
MKKLILVSMVMALLLVIAAGADDTKSNKINGWVSDVMCGAKGANAGHADCAKKCAEGGQMVVFVSDAEKKVWTVENPEALKGHEGHHVAITGQPDATKGSVRIDSVEMIAEASPDKGKNDGAHSHDKKKKT